MSDQQQAPPDQQQVPADSDVGWEELTSEKNQKYSVKASDYNIANKPTGEEAQAAAASGPSFENVAVNWPFGTSGTPSKDVQNKTAITWYKHDAAPAASIYKYELTISVSDTYNYTFTDEEPDTYKLNVWDKSGTHFVRFRSEKPTIVKISGS